MNTNWIQNLFLPIIEFIASNHVVEALIGIAIIIFGMFYVYPWINLRKELLRRTRELKVKQAELKTNATFLTRDQISLDGWHNTLQHLWVEYKETLHEQEVSPGVLRIRATLPASAFFSPQSVVETWLHTDFFKHLPGILTGLGIIGTFSGLIIGLTGFHVDNPTQTTQELQGLLGWVMKAFTASFLAIACAIILTFIEKILLTRAYRYLENFTCVVDALFESGVGEEYLASLVKSSQESTAQAKHLKQGMVDDLQRIMDGVVEALRKDSEKNTYEQIREQRVQSEKMATELANAITKSIQKTFEGPLKQITKFSGDVGNSHVTGLQDLITMFMGQLQTTVGSQMGQLDSMMGQSVNSMRSMQDNFAGLLNNLGHAGQDATNSISVQLKDALSQVQATQTSMVEHMEDVLTRMSMNSTSSQSELQSMTQRMVSQLDTQIQGMVRDLQTQRESLDEQGQRQIRDVMETVAVQQNRMMTDFSQRFDDLLLRVDQRNQQTWQSITEIQQESAATQDRMKVQGMESIESQNQVMQSFIGQFKQEVDRMVSSTHTAAQAMGRTAERLDVSVNQSATTLSGTVQKMSGIWGDFNKASETLLQATRQADQGYAKLLESTGNMGQTSTVLQQVAMDLHHMNQEYRQTHEQILQMTQSLQSMLETSKRDVSVNRNLLDQLENSVEKIQSFSENTQALIHATREYTTQLDDTLSSAFENFGEGVARSLQTSNQEFQKSLKEAADILSEVAAELQLAQNTSRRS
ncbi:MAG: anti-phage defense ZorAB system ZorA [SAR324 cluster bacterium]|nr:anti-phage defense ZorAB system ZorA [SAR324 cluster bacterium]